MKVRFVTTTTVTMTAIGLFLIAGPRAHTAQAAAPNPPAQPDVFAQGPAAWQKAAQQLTAGDNADLLTPITLKYTNADLKTILADISKQSGEEVIQPRWNRSTPPSISIDLNREPFWIALYKLCDKIGYTATTMSYQFEGQIQIGPVANEHFSPFVCADSPFLITLDKINRSYRNDLTQNDPANVNSNFTVSLSVWSDPQSAVLQQKGGVFLTEAVDDQGNSLLDEQPPTSQEWSLNEGGSPQIKLTAHLKSPAHPGAKIARLKGMIHVLQATQWQTAEIPDLTHAAGVSKTIGPYQFTLTEFKKTGEKRYSYRVKAQDRTSNLRLLPNKPRPPFIFWSIVDAQGKQLFKGYSGVMGGLVGGNVSGEPAKMILKYPAQREEHDISFEFHNIPMP